MLSSKNSRLSNKLARLDTNDNNVSLRRETKRSESSFFNVNPDNDSENEEPLIDDEMLADCELTLCMLYQSSKLGCSFYDNNRKTLFYLNDLPETSVSNFELTNLILTDLMPDKIITSSKSDSKFIEFLKKKCNLIDDKPESDSEKEMNSESENEQEDSGQEHQNIKFFLTTANDYNYEMSKELIYQIRTLDKMPQFSSVN